MTESNMEPSYPDPPAAPTNPPEAAPLQERTGSPGNLGLLMEIPLDVTLHFGRGRLTLREILALGPESVVELAPRLEDPVDLLVGGKLVGRGEVVTAEGRYGLKLTEILAPAARTEEE